MKQDIDETSRLWPKTQVRVDLSLSRLCILSFLTDIDIKTVSGFSYTTCGQKVHNRILLLYNTTANVVSTITHTAGRSHTTSMLGRAIARSGHSKTDRKLLSVWTIGPHVLPSLIIRPQGTARPSLPLASDMEARRHRPSNDKSMPQDPLSTVIDP